MRNKIAKRLRKNALRCGLVIHGEGIVFSSKELREKGWSSRENGYAILYHYHGHGGMVSDSDKLSAYRLLMDVIHEIDEEE